MSMMQKASKVELSIIIPLYNEERRFPKSFRKIDRYFEELGMAREYILVDDGSRDNTLKKVKTLKSKTPIRVLENPRNLGKGAALKLGVLSSLGKNILFTDADLSTPITEFEKLYSFLRKYDVAIGSRRLKRSNVKIEQPLHRKVLGTIFYLLFSFFFNSKVKDTNCGFKCFKGKIGREVYKKLTNARWGFDAEFIFLAEKYGHRIKEVPVTWLNDPHSRVSSLHASVNTVWELAKIRMNDVLGRYEDRKRSTSYTSDLAKRIMQFAVATFFKILFLLKGRPDVTPEMKRTVDLYKGGGFSELFTQIRLWDAPLEEVEKLIPKEGIVLDLGCGDGFLANYLATSSPKRKVVGIELSKERIKEADKGVKNTRFTNGDILKKEDLPESDTILLVHVLHHLPSYKDQEHLIKKCWEKLKKGRKLIIVEIDRYPLWKYLFTWITDAVIVPILFEKKFFTRDFYYRSAKDWRRLLSNSGFRVKARKLHNIHKGMPFSHLLLECRKK